VSAHGRASRSATTVHTSGSKPIPRCVEDTSTCSADGVARSMHACHATTPSRRENSTVSGTRIGEAAAGDTALLIAFGAGLSYAGQVVTVPPLAQE
jgi:hypothetical protein